MKELVRRATVFLLYNKLTPGDLTVRPARALHQRPGAFLFKEEYA